MRAVQQKIVTKLCNSYAYYATVMREPSEAALQLALGTGRYWLLATTAILRDFVDQQRPRGRHPAPAIEA